MKEANVTKNSLSSHAQQNALDHGMFARIMGNICFIPNMIRSQLTNSLK